MHHRHMPRLSGRVRKKPQNGRVRRLAELSALHGVTRERVRQLLIRAGEKLARTYGLTSARRP